MAAGERPFIGRLEAIDALRRRTDQAAEGRGGLSVLEGDGGVGKSLLLARVAQEVTTKGLRLLVGRAPPLLNPPPFLLIRRALESGAGPADAPPPPSSIAFLATGQGAPSSLLGFAPGADRDEHRVSWPVEERLLEQLVDAGGALSGGRDGMGAALADRLLALAAGGPTVLLLDDLHAADEPSLEVLRDLGPDLGRHALWVLATTLPLASLPEARRGLLEEICRRAGADRYPLRPLTAAEAGAFVRSLLPDGTVAEADVTRWHSQSGGNPQFLEELVRVRDPGAPGPAADEPPAAPVHGAAAGRLRREVARLPPDERRVLTVAAVLGREFPFALLLRATGEEEERLTELVQGLVQRGVLRETADEEVVFPRDELRRQVEHGLTETHRRLLHRRAAEALEAMGPPDEPTIYALALHYYRGQVDEKAAQFNRLAGELAARAHAVSTARVHLERALECQRRAVPPDPVRELDLTLELVVQLDRLGELATAEALLRAPPPPGTSPPIPPAQEALRSVYLARIIVNEGRWTEAEQLTGALLAPGAPEMPPLTRMALHRLRGEILYFLGRYDESLAHHDAALEIARTERNEREIAREMVRRANVLGMTPGRLDEAIEAYHIASRALIDKGDRGEASNALLYLGVVLAQHGRLAESLLQLAAAARLAEEAHEPRRLGWALFNAADVDREMGELDRARATNRRAREILTRVGDRYGLLQTHIVDGKILLASNELAAADVELLEAFRLVRELRTPPDELEVVLRRAELAERRGDAAAARRRLSGVPREHVAQLRPDLLPDLDRLRTRLGPPPPEEDGAPS